MNNPMIGGPQRPGQPGPRNIGGPAGPGRMSNMGPPGQGMPASQEQLDAQIKQAKLQNNPLPPGIEGLKILRALEQCAVMANAAKLNQGISQALELEVQEDGAQQNVLNGIAKAIAQSLRCETECQKNKKLRTVVVFENHNILKDTHTELQAAEKDVERLQEELENAAQKMQELSRQRWDTSVKTYGLNPEKYMYSINEEDGIIEEVSLSCGECAAVKDVNAAVDALNTLTAKVEESIENEETLDNVVAMSKGAQDGEE